MVRVELVVVLTVGLASLTGGMGAAEERTPGWEIFAEPESPRDTTFDLDSTSPPAKYSLDELTEPVSTDPDVYIRFTPGAKGAVSETAPPEGSAEGVLPSEPPTAPGEGPSEPSGFTSPPISLPQASGVASLETMNVEVPIVRTYPEYRKALEARAPVILFEGKRWVYSETDHRYVDPQQLLLEEARRAQQNVVEWNTEYSASEAPTGWDAFGIPGQDPYAELDQDPWADYLIPSDSTYSSTAREGGFRITGGQRRAFREPRVSPYEEGAPGSQEQVLPSYHEGFRVRRGQRRAEYPDGSVPPTTTWGRR